MTDLLLAKQKLPDGWIDAAPGEPHIIREALFKTFGLCGTRLVDLTLHKKAEYPSPNGYEPLVKLLEDKHQAPVVITNGAKQALAAAFYALHKAGKRKLGMRTPFWPLIPPLAKLYGLEHSHNEYDAYLAVLPNNPDGFCFDYDYAKWLSDYHRYLNIPFIHDGAYFSPIYLPRDFHFGPLGDLQVFSISKMYGISGLRIGYVVCYNTDYYHTIQEYIETTTVGVSAASQDICYNLLLAMRDKIKYDKFVCDARDQLYIAKALCKSINKDVLYVPNDVCNTSSMFGWFRVGPKCDFNKAKISVVPGKLFGDDSMVRINLALPTNTIIEMIERLNAL